MCPTDHYGWGFDRDDKVSADKHWKTRRRTMKKKRKKTERKKENIFIISKHEPNNNNVRYIRTHTFSRTQRLTSRGVRRTHTKHIVLSRDECVIRAANSTSNLNNRCGACARVGNHRRPRWPWTTRGRRIKKTNLVDVVQKKKNI